MPASWRTSDLTILFAAAAGTVLLTAGSFLAAPPELFPANDASTYAAHPRGARAAYLLLQQLGYRVERSFEPLASLAGRDPDRTVLVLASPSQPGSDLDTKALAAFVEAGGRVLATGSEAAAFLPGGIRRPPAAAPVEMQPTALPSPLTRGVAAVEMPASEHALPVDSPYVPVFGTLEEPAIVAARFGRGRVVWWASSHPLSNDGIQQHDHLPLLLNALGTAGERTVVWDEYYHGHARSVWSYIAATPLPAAIAQLALVAAIALFAFARRQAPIRSPAVEARTSPLEFIETMGGLYERAGASRAAVASIAGRVRRRLGELAGLPPSSDDHRVAEAAAERLGLGDAVAAAFARARAAAADPALTPAQAADVAARLQSLAAEARAAHRQRQRTP
jgi:hypothetical protein